MARRAIASNSGHIGRTAHEKELISNFFLLMKGFVAYPPTADQLDQSSWCI
jgi:hypothetical protein